MLYILVFTHILLSFQVLRGIWRCSFRLAGQCEGLYTVERVTGLAPRFLFVYINIFLPYWSLWIF